jgi:hypothetical protein
MLAQLFASAHIPRKRVQAQFKVAEKRECDRADEAG